MSSPEAGKKIAKEGVLKKRGGFRTNWLERKFVLKDGAIQYFENAKAAKFKGSVPTMFISEVRKTFPDMGGKADRKQTFRFEFYAKSPQEKEGRTYFLSAKTEKEQDEWIEAIKSWVGVVDETTRKASQQGTRNAGADDEEGDEKPAAGGAAPAAASAAAATSDAKKEGGEATTTAAATATTTAATPSDADAAAKTDADTSKTVDNAPAAKAVVREEMSPNPDGSIRIVCEGGDAESVAAAAREAVAKYAATHAAIQLDEGFAEVSRTVTKNDTPDGFDEITTVVASDGKGTTKTYTNTVSIKNRS